MSDLHFMGRNNRVRISHFRQCSVSGPVAGAYRAARFHRLRCEGGEALLRGVRDHSQPDPPDPIVPLVLDRDRHKGLAERPATSLSGFLAAHVGFIHLDDSPKPVAIRSNHRPSHFVKPRPCRLITAQLQHPLDTWPTEIGKIAAACLLRREAALEIRKIAGVIVHPHRHYMLW